MSESETRREIVRGKQVAWLNSCYTTPFVTHMLSYNAKVLCITQKSFDPVIIQMHPIAQFKHTLYVAIGLDIHTGPNNVKLDLASPQHIT